MTDGSLRTAQTKAKSFWKSKPGFAEVWDRRSPTPSMANSTSPWQVVQARLAVAVVVEGEVPAQAPAQVQGQQERAALNLCRRTLREPPHKQPQQPLKASAPTRHLRRPAHLRRFRPFARSC